MNNLTIAEHPNKDEYQFIVDVGDSIESCEEVLRALHELLAVGKPIFNKEIFQRDGELGTYRELKNIAEFTQEAKSKLFHEFGLNVDSCEKEQFIQCFVQELKKSLDGDPSKEIEEVLQQFFDDCQQPLAFTDAPESYVHWLEKCAEQSANDEQDKSQKLIEMFDLHCKVERSHTSTKREIYNIVQYELVYSIGEVEKIIDSLNTLNSIIERPQKR